MRKQFSIIILVTFLLYGCNEKSLTPCDCCQTAYTKMDDALKCIDENPRKTSYDNRLLLLAFSSLKNKSWDIIEDLETISIAKRNYLLVVTNTEVVSNYAKTTPELNKLITKYEGQEIFFVVVNQALYPIRDWGENESKEHIINELQLGDGP